jgi:hypothetical protein
MHFDGKRAPPIWRQLCEPAGRLLLKNAVAFCNPLVRVVAFAEIAGHRVQ